MHGSYAQSASATYFFITDQRSVDRTGPAVLASGDSASATAATSRFVYRRRKPASS